MPYLPILLVVTSADQLGSAPGSTGYWLEEVAAPYYVFTDAGYEVQIASPQGGTPPRDPESDKSEHKDKDSLRFEADTNASQKLANSILLSTTTPADYAAVFFAGGHGTMTDFPTDADIIRTVEAFTASGKPVASVCHGPACLVSARDTEGRPIIQGKRFTCFTNAEERAAGAEKRVPFLLQSTLEQQGGIFCGGETFASCAVTDGNIITGQNPASGAQTAQLVLNMLGKHAS